MYRIYTAIAIPVIFFSMGLLAYMLWRFCKYKSSQSIRIIFLVLSLIFIGLETSKQIYEFCRPDGYRLYSIPLHVCSFFVFFPVFAACMKQEWTITKVFWALSINSAVIVSVSMLVAPEIIMGLQVEAVMKSTGSYIEYHSVIHHTLIVLYTFMALFLRPWKPNINESIWAGCIWGGFLLVAWIMANVTNTDFSSFLRFGNSFLMQLLVWSVHVLCFAVSSVILLFGTKKLEHLQAMAGWATKKEMEQ